MKCLAVIFALLYNLALIAGTAYLVVVYDWNPWTFLATACFCASTRDLLIIRTGE